MSEKREEPPRLKGFDEFESRLGDIMRGERATLGKSLLDVQRELKIRVAYIVAIENCDPFAFEIPGFIAGYVRSYARYLGMDPEQAYADFRRESGFRAPNETDVRPPLAKASRPNHSAEVCDDPDPFTGPNRRFLPPKEPAIGPVDLPAIGSIAILLVLIGGIGIGGWAVLKQIQRVDLVDGGEAPLIGTAIDPLESGTYLPTPPDAAGDDRQNEVLARLYRPEALDVPILEPRDGPIAAVDPRSYGVFVAPAPIAAPPDLPEQPPAVAAGPEVPPKVQVIEKTVPAVALVAVRPAWVRVSGADGSVLLEKTLSVGERFVVPATEDPPSLWVGESGAVYFAIGSDHHGPAGPNGKVTRNIVLAADALRERYEIVDLARDNDLSRVVTQAQAGIPAPPPE